MCWVVPPVLINVHRRWLLPAILGGAVLLLASTGLFLMLRPTAPAAATRPAAVQRADTDSNPLADANWPTVERMGRSRRLVHLGTQRGLLERQQAGRLCSGSWPDPAAPGV